MNEKTHKKLHVFVSGLFDTPSDTLGDLGKLRKEFKKMIKMVKWTKRKRPKAYMRWYAKNEAK